MAAHARRSRKRRFSLSRGLLIRLLLIAPLVIAAGWLTIAVSAASLYRVQRPDRALAFRSGDARALAKSAEQLLTRTPMTRANIDAAERLALAALRRDPTTVIAWRSLGVVETARRRARPAERYFRFAATLSRRDVPTLLWLIEERVQADDIRGALRQYDVALRGSRAAQQLLLPILVSATSSDAILQPLADLINERPPWRRSFLDNFVGGGPQAGRFVQFSRLIFRTLSDEEKARLAQALPGLVERRQFGDAEQLYRMLTPGAGQPQLLRNGGFEQASRYPPLDWQLQDGEFGAEMEGVAGRSERRLRVYAASGVGGLVARQLIFLPPGSYELGATLGTVPDFRPARIGWTVQCASARGTILLRQDLTPRSGGPGRAAAAFTVPGADCPAQWLNLGVVADFDPGGIAGWMDSLTVRRR